MSPKTLFFLRNIAIFIPLVFVFSIVMDYAFVMFGADAMTTRQIIEEAIFKGIFLGATLGIITSIGKFKDG